MIICPLCNKALKQINNSFKCSNNHNYDLSKEGYLNLLLNRKNAGDNKVMVASRKAFLDKGYFNQLREYLENLLPKYNLLNKDILDLGCGDGFYSSAIGSSTNLIGIDISKEAIKIAAKRDKVSRYIVASINNLPLAQNSVDGIINIFAPIDEDEVARVLKSSGLLIKVSPATDHLIELKEVLYDNVYPTSEKEISNSRLLLLEESRLTYKRTVNNEDLLHLVKMTPYFYTTRIENLKKLNSIKQLAITFSFKIDCYQHKAISS